MQELIFATGLVTPGRTCNTAHGHMSKSHIPSQMYNIFHNYGLFEYRKFVIYNARICSILGEELR